MVNYDPHVPREFTDLVNGYESTIKCQKAEVKALEAENERLRIVLRWYADEDNYQMNLINRPVIDDLGDLARKALGA